MNGRKFLDDGSNHRANIAGNGNALTAQEQAVLETIRATPFGTVEVVLHQSRIVQVVKTEKVKLEPDPQQR
jgi:hypothetical protein